jgi:competence protein ComEC
MAAALGYCLLAGWGVPAQRTFFMLCAVALALVARVPMRPTVTLALAAAVVTLIDPWATFAPGFWLSFGAVAAILLVMHGRALAPAPGWRARLLDAGYAQGAVTVALVPLTIALFQQVSLVSLVVTPLALLGALLLALPAPFDTLAVPALAIGHWLFALLGGLLQGLGAPALSIAALPAPPAWALAFAAAGVLWLLAPRGWPLRWLGLLWLLPLVVWPPQRPASGELWVTAIDIGQGAAVLLETHDATVLYDTGPRWSPQADAGGRTILPYLRWRGIGRLDLLVVSHLDSDHSGGAASIVRGIEVGAVLTSIDAGHAALGGAANVRRCERGQSFAFGTRGGLSLTVVHPPADDYARGNRSTNAMSCVLAASVGALRVLLTGDLPAREEAELLASGGLDPLVPFTLVAAPHHGSRHSSSQALVDAVRPRWVLVQAGYRNRFGHPAPEVVARWQAAGATALRTDLAGAVQWRLRADGDAAIALARADRRRYWNDGYSQDGYSQDGHRPDRANAAGESTDGEDDEMAPASRPGSAGLPRTVPETADE